MSWWTFFFFPHMLVSHSFYRRWYWKLKIQTQTFYIRTRRMTTVMLSLVPKGLEMYAECELLQSRALYIHRARYFHLPSHNRQNWRKKNSHSTEGRENRDARPNQEPTWIVLFFKDTLRYCLWQGGSKTACRKAVLFRKKVHMEG